MVVFEGEDVWLDVLTLLVPLFFLCLWWRWRRHNSVKKHTKTAPAITREDKGTQTELRLERMEHVWASQGGECFHADAQCRGIRQARLATKSMRFCKLCATNSYIERTSRS